MSTAFIHHAVCFIRATLEDNLSGFRIRYDGAGMKFVAPNKASERTNEAAPKSLEHINILSPFHGCGQKPTQSCIRHNTFCKDLFACTEIAHHHFLSLYK